MQIFGTSIKVRSHLLRPSRSIGMSHILVPHLPQPQSWLNASTISLGNYRIGTIMVAPAFSGGSSLVGITKDSAFSKCSREPVT